MAAELLCVAVDLDAQSVHRALAQVLEHPVPQVLKERRVTCAR